MKNMMSLRINDSNDLILVCAFNCDNKVLHLNFDASTRSADLLTAILMLFDGEYTDIICAVPVGYDVGNIPFICNDAGIILRDYTVTVDSDNAEKNDDTDLSANEELREDVVKYLSEKYDFCDDELDFLDKISYDDYVVDTICSEFDIMDNFDCKDVILSARDEFVDIVSPHHRDNYDTGLGGVYD